MEINKQLDIQDLYDAKIRAEKTGATSTESESSVQIAPDTAEGKKAQKPAGKSRRAIVGE